MCSSNQNTLINICECHNIAFDVKHCVELVKIIGGDEPTVGRWTG